MDRLHHPEQDQVAQREDRRRPLGLGQRQFGLQITVLYGKILARHHDPIAQPVCTQRIAESAHAVPHGHRMRRTLNTGDAAVAVLQQVFGRHHRTAVVVRRDVRQHPGIGQVAVDQHQRHAALLHACEQRSVVAARRSDDSIHTPRQQGRQSVLLVALVLLRVDHHHLIVIIARLADHHARDIGKKRVFDIRNQQADRIGTICAQTLCQQAGRIVTAFDLLCHARHGTLTDAVFGRIAAQNARNSGNRTSGTFGDANESFFFHCFIFSSPMTNI